MKLFNLNHLLLRFTILALTLGISACSNQQVKNLDNTIPAAPYAKEELFGPRPELNDVDDLFRLNEDQLADFRTFYNSHTNRHILPNNRIYKYLQRYVKNYNFFNKTLTAEQSIAQSQGNCLSLAILTTALAKAAGVDTGYQLVESDPVYQKEGNVVISSQHVRSLLYDAELTDHFGYVIGSRPGIIIDYFPTNSSRVKRKVKDKEFFAMYYRNTAADAIISEDYDSAYWLLKEALILSPNDEHAINMMAVVHENKGLDSMADKIYLHGLKYSSEKLDLLRNYHQFLTNQNRFNDAKRVKSQLARMKVINPFDWINLGHIAFLEEKFVEARRYYKKALKIAPYLHQGHLGVAKSEFRLGNIGASKASMKLAKKNAFDIKTKDLYEYKMSALAKF